MRAISRLAISSLLGRPGRSALLLAAVTLSAALVASVSSALASVNSALEQRVQATVGRADLRIKPSGKGDALDESIVELVRGWPEVAEVAGLRRETLAAGATHTELVEQDGSWRPTDVARRAPVMANAFDRVGWDARPIELIAGRLPRTPDEIVVDVLLAVRLSWHHEHVYLAKRKGRAERAYGLARANNPARFQPADSPAETDDADQARRANTTTGPKIGDTITLSRLLRGSADYTIVGVADQPPLGGRPQAFLTLDGLARVGNRPGVLSEVDIILFEGVDAQATAEAHRADLPGNMLLQTTSRITSDAAGNMRMSQFGFVLASTLAFLSASFIIMTGLTTDVTQRQRELAVLRCIGAGRGQMAAAQILTGLIIGMLGAIIGTPLGILVAWILSVVFRDNIPTGLSVSPFFIGVTIVGTIIAGLLGAAWPAWRVARISPLEGLTVRATAPSRRGLIVTTVCALSGLAIQGAVISIPTDGQVVFWGYATLGLPAMFIGYFLLGVPLVLLIARVIGPTLGRVLGLGPKMLRRTIEQTPYRHGFTAGAMMTGLALMVTIWTIGSSLLDDWLDRLAFPDAFVSGVALSEDSKATLDAMDFVLATSAVTLHPVETDAFGIQGLQRIKTTFVAFEPGPFLDMTNLEWVQGDVETARTKLEAGGSILVAREFLVAKGLGVGDTFTCWQDGQQFDFEIVGVVMSPGLDIVSKFFNIGDEYTDQAIHAVFGSRDDLKNLFGVEAIHMIQIDLSDDIDDDEAVAIIREALFDAGVLDAGSGRKIMQEIKLFIGSALAVITTIAIVSMGVASFGVANLIAAGVHARRFEFGVLRAVGAQRGTLVRLVLGEAVIIALAAIILGTAMGLQGSWAEQTMERLLLGIVIQIRPPWVAIGTGALIVLTMTVGAATPTIVHLARRQTRELLAAINP